MNDSMDGRVSCPDIDGSELASHVSFYSRPIQLSNFSAGMSRFESEICPISEIFNRVLFQAKVHVLRLFSPVKAARAIFISTR